MAGTNLSRTNTTRFLFISLIVLNLNSCASDSQNASNDLDDIEEEFEHDAADVADNSETPHPKVANAWYTRTLIATQPQPDASEIADCQEDVRAAAENAANQNDLIAMSRTIEPLIKQKPKVFHWCFYQMAASLDERLQLGGPLMTELADAFFYSMTNMWILATALDEYNDTDRYFSYLRSRYIQISKDYFGRDLMIVSEPNANLPLTNTLLKPAGEADVE